VNCLCRRQLAMPRKKIEDPGERYQWMYVAGLTETDLSRLIDLVKDEYVSRKRLIYPNYHLKSTKYGADFWYKVVRRIKDNDLDPMLYVAAIMDAYKSTAYPTMLLSGDFRSIYERYTTTSDPRLREQIYTELNRQIAYVELRCKQNGHLRSILEDGRNGFNALFVWCMAKANNFEDLVVANEPLALKYLARPLYKEAYTAAFPMIEEKLP